MISVSCLDSKLLNNNNWYGRFQLTPFKKGEGLTIANALRRTLLTEKSNFYIRWVDFYNAEIPYSILTGMRESIFDILLNLKQIVFTSDFILFVNRPRNPYKSLKLRQNHKKYPLYTHYQWSRFENQLRPGEKKKNAAAGMPSESPVFSNSGGPNLRSGPRRYFYTPHKRGGKKSLPGTEFSSQKSNPAETVRFSRDGREDIFFQGIFKSSFSSNVSRVTRKIDAGLPSKMVLWGGPRHSGGAGGEFGRSALSSDPQRSGPEEFVQDSNNIVRGSDLQSEPERLFEDSTQWIVKPQPRNVFKKKDFSHFLRSFLYSKNKRSLRSSYNPSAGLRYVSGLPENQRHAFSNGNRGFSSQAPNKKESVNIGYICVKGPAVITAKHLKLPKGLKCIDPEKYILTLADDGFFYIRFAIQVSGLQHEDKEENSIVSYSEYSKGRRYAPANLYSPFSPDPFTPGPETYRAPQGDIFLFQRNCMQFCGDPVINDRSGLDLQSATLLKQSIKSSGGRPLIGAPRTFYKNFFLCSKKTNGLFQIKFLFLLLYQLSVFSNKINPLAPNLLSRALLSKLNWSFLKKNNFKPTSITANSEKTCLLNFQIKHYYVKSGRFDRFLINLLQTKKPSISLKSTSWTLVSDEGPACNLLCPPKIAPWAPDRQIGGPCDFRGTRRTDSEKNT